MTAPKSSRRGSEKRRKDRILALRCDARERKRWARQAVTEGMPLAIWVRRLLNQYLEELDSRASHDARERR